MEKDQYGRPKLTVNEALEALYYGNDLKSAVIDTDGWVLLDDNEIERFYESAKWFDEAGNFRIDTERDIQLGNFIAKPDHIHRKRQRNWLIEQKYYDLDIEEFLINKCETEEEEYRVAEELALFQKYDLEDTLLVMKYLVDKMRENKVIWGVGRGSSVASFCLYLIGAHRINPMKYGLDINEFLKDQ